MEQTFALITLVQPVLHKIYCCNETIPNPSEHYETGPNMSLGSYGLDRLWPLPKLPTRLHSINIRINRTSLGHFAPSFMQLRNGPQCTQTLQNTTKHDFRVQWGGLGAFVRKIPTRLYGTNFYINCTSLAHFDWVSCSNKMVPNAPKHYKTWV
jgi:hypothetical protein